MVPWINQGRNLRHLAQAQSGDILVRTAFGDIFMHVLPNLTTTDKASIFRSPSSYRGPAARIAETVGINEAFTFLPFQLRGRPFQLPAEFLTVAFVVADGNIHA